MTTTTTVEEVAKAARTCPICLAAPHEGCTTDRLGVVSLQRMHIERDAFVSLAIERAYAAEAKLAKIARTRRPTEEESAEAGAAYASAAKPHLLLVASAPRIPYTIRGELYPGEETPAFRADLLSLEVPIARLASDGCGGCARITWLGITADTRSAAMRWLATEAMRLWPSEYGAAPDSITIPEEAAILVVPAHIGAPMVARYHTSEMEPGQSCDLRAMLECNAQPDLQAKLRAMNVGDVLHEMVTVTRIS